MGVVKVAGGMRWGGCGCGVVAAGVVGVNPMPHEHEKPENCGGGNSDAT